MSTKAITVVLISIFLWKSIQSRKYHNYALISVTPITPKQLKFLFDLEKSKFIDISFWEKPSKFDKEVVLLVSPTDMDLFKQTTKAYNINYSVRINDIQSEFDKQIVGGYRKMAVDTFQFDNFHNLADIYQWLSDLTKRHAFIKMIPIGLSSELREIFVMRLNKYNATHKVIVEAGIHGHEWLSVAFATYFLSELINADYSESDLLRSLAHGFEWLVIPVLNPDGYVYSHSKDRLWRKNRRLLDDGIGVDLNRNFDKSFGKFSSGKIPHDDNYCGPEPFSEPETQTLQKLLVKNSENLMYYFSIHSYGEMIVLPFEDKIDHEENFSEMEDIATQAVYTMYQVNGTMYRTGSMYDLKGTRMSGTSTSWVKKTYRVPYVFTWFLRDSGIKGHALASEEIIPSSKEATAGIIELMTATSRPRTNHNTATICCINSFLFFLSVLVVFK